MKGRSILIPFLGAVILGLMLAFATGANAAPGDPPFSLGGILTLTGSDFSIKGQSIVVNAATVCTDLPPAIPPDTTQCADLKDKLVKAVGYISQVDSKYYATSITAQPETTVFSYTGELTLFSAAAWTIDTFEFRIGLTTIVPPFFAISDTVVSTYTVEIATGNFLSKEFVVLDSGVDNTYTYTGTLTAINGDLWTVGDFTFLMEGVTLPPHFAVNDTVVVTFKIVEGKNVAISVKVTETFVGPKVESNRCENRIKEQPAIYRLASELEEDPEQLTNYFCLGFGVGEIRLAYKLAGNGYTPAMLLALRASEMGWGEIKKLVASALAAEPGAPVAPSGNETIKNNNPGTNTGPGSSANNSRGNNGRGPDKEKSNHGKKK